MTKAHGNADQDVFRLDVLEQMRRAQWFNFGG
jgi:hypothetical protein